MTGIKVPKWESELWSYISSGDGVHCPLYDTCKIRQGCRWCFNDNQEIIRGLCGTDTILGSISDASESDIFRCMYEYIFPLYWKPGRIFQLVESLAEKYIKKAKLSRPPVLTELVEQLGIIPGIEIRPLLLKAYHGAV